MAEVLAADIVQRRELVEGTQFAERTAGRADEATGAALEALEKAFGGEEGLQGALARGFNTDEARRAQQAMSTASVQPQVSGQLETLVDRLSKTDFSKADGSEFFKILFFNTPSLIKEV